MNKPRSHAEPDGTEGSIPSITFSVEILDLRKTIRRKAVIGYVRNGSRDSNSAAVIPTPGIHCLKHQRLVGRPFRKAKTITVR